MRLIELHPDWSGVNDPEKIIDEIGNEALFALTSATAEYYEQHLPLWQVMNHYGIEDVAADTEQAYVPCRLASHGTYDKHASASYFTVDRNSGEYRPAFYCYKCQKMLTSFWYTYQMEKDWNDLTKFRDLYKFIWRTFRVAPPLDIWFNFDAEQHFMDFGSDDTAVDVSVFFREALQVRAMKEVDPRAYLRHLARLITSATVQNE